MSTTTALLSGRGRSTIEPMRLLRVLPGFGLYVVLAVLAFIYIGGHVDSLLRPGELFAVIFLPLAPLVGAYGIVGTGQRFLSLFSERRRIAYGFTPEALGRAISFRIGATYGAAILAAVFEIVRASGFFGMADGKAVGGEIIACGLGAFFLAALLCEGLFRPMQYRLLAETRPQATESTAPTLLLRPLFGFIVFGLLALLIAGYDGVFYRYSSYIYPALFYLFDPPILISAFLLPLASLVGAYGFSGTARRLVALVAGRRPAEAVETLSLWSAALYGTALLSLVGGIVVTSGFLSGDGSVIGEKIRWSVAVFVWTLPLAEGLLRPLKHRFAEAAHVSPSATV